MIYDKNFLEDIKWIKSVQNRIEPLKKTYKKICQQFKLD